jgi:hypothetical protein
LPVLSVFCVATRNDLLLVLLTFATVSLAADLTMLSNTGMPRITSVTTTFIKSIVTTSDSGLVELHHGASFEDAIWMEKNRLDVARAAANGGEGKFWLAARTFEAGGFAVATMSDKPTIISIQFPFETLVTSVTAGPPNAFIHPVNETHYFEFLETGFPILNEAIVSITLRDARTELRKK